MVSVIVAMSRNGVIGCANRLIWHISEDLKRFKAITTGHPVVMGRRTFESIGRPLPNRTNVVITRQKNYAPEGVAVAHSLDEAVKMFPPDEEVFIIGGGEIYSQAMPIADKFYLTEVLADYGGDTLFPAWNPAEWTLVSEERHERGEKFEHPFAFRDYIRTK